MWDRQKSPKIDWQIASQALLDQTAMELHRTETIADISHIRIAERCGRFGNNFYQLLHAVFFAKRLKVRDVLIPPFDCMQDHISSRLRVTRVGVSDQHFYEKKKMLVGSFYAPFGFEALFRKDPIKDVNALLKRVVRPVYASLFSTRTATQKLVLHFRAGDIFSSFIHPYYVQPPTSFYVKALVHALDQKIYDEVHLVYEDRSNPTIEMVEAFLGMKGIAFISQACDIKTDLQRLTSASCVIASSSTFVEASAILSQELRSYYSFRSHSSQSSLSPFLQTRVGALLKAKGARCYLVQDIAFKYTDKGSWKNSTDQINLMKQYDISNLHLFESC